MELLNVNIENSFDPIPKLKSSPIPILFISFNIEDNNCIYCGDKYTEIPLYYQKYCKKSLSYYITNITDNDVYLDVYIYTAKSECSEHKMSNERKTHKIQEYCSNCSEVQKFFS